jgi:hypothetical protein
MFATVILVLVVHPMYEYYNSYQLSEFLLARASVSGHTIQHCQIFCAIRDYLFTLQILIVQYSPQVSPSPVNESCHRWTLNHPWDGIQ